MHQKDLVWTGTPDHHRLMPDYRRYFTPGAMCFFTVNLKNRKSTLLTDRIENLRQAWRKTATDYRFETLAVYIRRAHLRYSSSQQEANHRLTSSLRRPIWPPGLRHLPLAWMVQMVKISMPNRHLQSFSPDISKGLTAKRAPFHRPEKRSGLSHDTLYSHPRSGQGPRPYSTN